MIGTVIVRVCLDNCCRDPIYANIVGDPVSHGLVLHPRVELICGVGQPNPTKGYVITEPRTGFKVAEGEDRRAALADLARKIDAMGGAEAFDRAVADGIDRVCKAGQFSVISAGAAAAEAGVAA